MRFLPFLRNGRGKARREGQNHVPFYLGRNFSRFSSQVEEYRTLRTAIDLMSQGRDSKTILITSPGPGEGKSTIVVNLGLLFWEFGRNVILIDCDLRMPSLHKAFALRNVKGITDLLAGNAEPQSVLTHVADGFAVLTRGTVAANPAILLRSLAFQEAITFYRDQADIVLIDSSPLLVVSDTIQMVPTMDEVILVVQAGRTRRNDLVRAKRLLAAARGNLLGTVLNKVEPRESNYYYRDKSYRHYFQEGQVTRDTNIRRSAPPTSPPAPGS